jgi:predicted nucleic acid-binding Zn ribbon protein
MLIPFNLHDKCKICGKARQAEETVVDLNIKMGTIRTEKKQVKRSEMARVLLYTYISYLVVVFINYSQPLKNRKVKTLFYQMLPDFRKNMAFIKFTTLFPFFLLVRASCRQR